MGVSGRTSPPTGHPLRSHTHTLVAATLDSQVPHKCPKIWRALRVGQRSTTFVVSRPCQSGRAGESCPQLLAPFRVDRSVWKQCFPSSPAPSGSPASEDREHPSHVKAWDGLINIHFPAGRWREAQRARCPGKSSERKVQWATGEARRGGSVGVQGREGGGSRIAVGEAANPSDTLHLRDVIDPS